MACCGMSAKRIIIPPIESPLSPEQQADIEAVEASQLIRRAYPTLVTKKSDVVPKVFPKPRRSPVV